MPSLALLLAVVAGACRTAPPPLPPPLIATLLCTLPHGSVTSLLAKADDGFLQLVRFQWSQPATPCYASQYPSEDMLMLSGEAARIDRARTWLLQLDRIGEPGSVVRVILRMEPDAVPLPTSTCSPR